MNISSALINKIIVEQDMETWGALESHYLPTEYQPIFRAVETHFSTFKSLPTFDDLKLSLRDQSIKEKIFAIETLDVDTSIKEELKKIVEFNSNAEKISEKFWPGQVTLLLPIRKEISEKIESNGKLAVRVPGNECILSVLKQCKLIIGTSANISGEKSILNSDEFKIKLPKVDTLVDGGKIVSKGESTIIDFNNGELKIIREGSVSKEEIEKIL